MLTAIGQNDISFKMTPVGTISFEQKGMFLCRHCNLALSRLDKNDVKDQKTVRALKKLWNGYYVKDEIAADFCNGFLNATKESAARESDFYILESPGTRKLYRRIVGILEMQGNNMRNLRVAPKYTKGRLFRKIKGLGEILFAEAANIAQIKKLNILEFKSLISAIPFYMRVFQNAGMRQCRDFDINLTPRLDLKFSLLSGGLKRLKDYIGEKYKTTFPSSV